MKKPVLIITIGIIIVIAIFSILSGGKNKITNYASSGTDIIAIGDSLVKGVGASSEENNFISLLSRKIDLPIINLGVSGNTTADVLSRLSDLDPYNPKVVILLAGGNDRIRRIPSADTFSNLAKIIEHVQSRGAIVLLLGIKGSILGDAYEAKFEKLRDTYNTAYVEDVLDGLFGNAKFMADGIHPNDAGNALIADKVYPKLEALIK